MSDKTEDPTPRALAKAREKGDVPVSGFASQALGNAVAVLLAPAACASAAAGAERLLRRALEAPGAIDVADAGATVLGAVVPWMAAAAGAALLATLAQTGGLFAPARLRLDLARLDPIAGLGALVSRQRLWVVARALVAAVGVAWLAARRLRVALPDLAHVVGPRGSVALASVVALGVARDAAAVFGALALVDLLVTRRSWLGRHRMTKAEVKQEHREAEGDPQQKAARERAHREMLAAAALHAVKEATVVIVNPEHLATALRYRDDEDDAPTVLAQGQGELAARIREAARAYGVPIVRDVPVARALAEVEVGSTIPEALYEAVAEILREVWDEAERAGDAG